MKDTNLLQSARQEAGVKVADDVDDLEVRCLSLAWSCLTEGDRALWHLVVCVTNSRAPAAAITHVPPYVVVAHAHQVDTDFQLEDVRRIFEKVILGIVQPAIHSCIPPLPGIWSLACNPCRHQSLSSVIVIVIAIAIHSFSH